MFRTYWKMILLTASAAPLAAAEFTPLPFPPGAQETRALGISDDGQTVVGSLQVGTLSRAFRWQVADPAITLLPDLAGGAVQNQALAISADGQTVAGQGTTALGAEAFIRAGNNPPQGLSDLPGGFDSSSAASLSGNGLVAVGTGHSLSGREAFRWTAADGLQPLGFLAEGVASEALAVSTDGHTVVGVSETFTTILGEAFRWTAAAGMVGLGDLPGGDNLSRATAVADQGTWVAGMSNSVSGNEAFRWSPGSGMQGLGDLPGGTFTSTAYDLSDDGSVVVGAAAHSDANTTAFLWSAATGMQPLADLLRDEFGLSEPLVGWDLLNVQAISADSRFLVGTGINPAGQLQAWRVEWGDTFVNAGAPSTEDLELGLGDHWTGHGALGGQVQIQAGATMIAAGGELTLGSELRTQAVQIAGRLIATRDRVRLLSASPVPVHGAILLHSQDEGLPGGATLQYDQLTLHGVIQAGQLIGQTLDLQGGTILGQSATNRTSITGRVSGQGFLDHVELLGELSPSGDQAADLLLGNVRYHQTTLELDVQAGPSGQAHDRLLHDGIAEMMGTVQIELRSVTPDQDPATRGEHAAILLISAKELRLTGDAQLAIHFEGLPIPPLDAQTMNSRVHAGQGLFRIAQRTDQQLSLINYRALTGDSNGDGRFSTDDLVHVLQINKYEDEIVANADWTEGDWNLDLEFDSGDFVEAFQAGTYESESAFAAIATVPEPASHALLLLTLPGVACFSRYTRRNSTGSARTSAGGWPFPARSRTANLEQLA